jgi:hypothetical protein
MMEAGEDLRLPLEPRHRAGIPIVSKQLDRYGSLKAKVLSAADLGHQTLSEHVPQAIPRSDEPMCIDRTCFARNLSHEYVSARGGDGRSLRVLPPPPIDVPPSRALRVLMNESPR